MPDADVTPWLSDDPVESAARLTETFVGNLHELLAMSADWIGPGRAVARLPVHPGLFAGNGLLHAAAVVALADSAAGFGCMATLPEGAVGFSTVELKSNHLGTAADGDIVVEATLVHGGRSTQVWDATVRSEASGRTIAVFRCTQLILYPR